MIKIIILVTLILIILSLYIKNKFLKVTKKILIVLTLICIINLFQNNTISLENKTYLYGTSDFEKYASYAQASMKKTGVYASLTLAQAAVEQSLKVPYHNNLFGIKATSSWTGDKVKLRTTECNSNGCYKTYAWFRKYDTVEGSFTDHGYWLINTFANRNDFKNAPNLIGQIKSLTSNSHAMYATDPQYVCKIISVINKYDLTKYDDGINYSGNGMAVSGTHTTLSADGCASSGTSSSDENINYDPGTTYSGKITDGYLFRRLKEEEGTYSGFNDDTLAQKLLDTDADKIIAEIYRRVVVGTEYNNSASQNEISGISENIGGIDAGEASTWRQYDTRWGSISLGLSSYTIKSAGCAATSVAIQISRSGVSLASDFNANLNPGSFVQYLNKHNGFTTGGSINWATASTVAPSFKYATQVKVNSSNVLSTIATYLKDDNYYLIVHVGGSKTNITSNHWLAVTGVTNNDIIVIDPAGRGTSIETAYGVKYVDRVSVYRAS